MLSILTVVTLFVQAAAPAQELRGEALMHALRGGGYTLLVRHARTDRSIPTRETPGYSPPLRADQRNLTPEGEQDVRLMARLVARYGLPISEVISSPIYRCKETADAFGAPKLTMALRVFPTTDETAAIVTATPRPGTIRVLVTHHFVIEALVPGIAPGAIGESEVAVVRPNGHGGVELVGRITLADWSALAGTETASSAEAAPMDHGAPSAHGARVTLPTTRIGTLATRYIETFNSGDTARMRVFTEAYMTPVPDRPTEARVQRYAQLFAEHGPIMVIGVESSTDNEVALQGHTRVGELVVRVTAAPDGRIQSLAFALHRGGTHR
ncbi:MAG TPA: histidine phosphatase family protein [Gemmatimonadales bacterium]